MHKKAERLRNSREPKADPTLAGRLPPGQVLTERFPILHEGEVPEYDLATWSLRVFGAVSQPVELSYDDLLTMPQRQVQCDIHCVTRWSKFDTRWSGVHMSDLFTALDIQPSTGFVMAHGDSDYQTNLTLDDLLHPDSLLALSYEGLPLTPQHGWPLRLVVAGRYFWKSAKWLRGLEFTEDDRPGFWENNGFHMQADPFKEERFSGDALNIPDDEWTHKDFD